MATVNLGRIKPVFRGAFSNSTAYVIDDIVTSGNETFIAIAATQGNATSDASKWTKLAAKGADGTDVGATLANKEIAFKTNAGAVDGIPIGTAGQFLKVNSGATGYEFGTAGGTNTPAWSVYRSTNQDSISNSSFTKVQFNVEDFDTDNAYDHNGGNYHFTVPSGKAGKYFIHFQVNVGAIGDNRTERVYTRLRKNGATLLYGVNQDLTGDADAINHNTYGSSCIVDLAVGDDIDVQAYHQFNTASTGRFMGDSNKVTRFSGFKLL